MSRRLRAPFPWFGGKSRVADGVWLAFGDVRNYVEPFFGSGAVLLARPTPARVETVNDLDAYLANFWRAITAAADEVARWADWPVNEADLHARHRWLVDQVEFRERGYEGEHDMLESWRCLAWRAQGGFAGQGDGSNRNFERERIWFSPHCLDHQRQLALFEAL